MSKLMLHAGGQVASLLELRSVSVPDRTDTWVPVPHDEVVDSVHYQLESAGIRVAEESFALSKGGARMFGVITLHSESEYATTIGVRNSHDRSFPVGLALGSRVFVCDNLAFSSEVVIKTRHTVNVLHRLPRLISSGVARLIDARGQQDARIAAYQSTKIERTADLHDLTLRAFRAGAIPAKAITEVIAEYEKPRHVEFSEPTVWSFFNACTEVLKNYGDTLGRTQRLHGVVDANCVLAV